MKKQCNWSTSSQTGEYKKKKREREDTNYHVSVFIWKMAKDSKYWAKETNNVKVIKSSRSDRVRKDKKEV